MELTKLGWNADLSQQFAPHHTNGLVPARVAVEDKHFFRVWTADAELLAKVSGKCIHEARWSNSKLPKVGDWVAVKLVPNGSRKHRARFNEAAVGYLEHRTNLCLVFALIDSSLAPQKIDLEFVEWLVHHAVPFVLVFTKTDKVPAVTAQVNLAAFTDRISAWFEKLPAVFTSSAETGQGRQELLGVIDESMTAINAASSGVRVHAESLSPQTRGRENRKRRPDL